MLWTAPSPARECHESGRFVALRLLRHWRSKLGPGQPARIDRAGAHANGLGWPMGKSPKSEGV
jgi:hypothetical protein